ncbi:enoyl-CoA hydratase/isomerase family protein [Bermanella marisrubri]|uniref:Probable enoyl-CoA hydratase/isomerase n=1 Tax=Bermanella marisrubri TaxID=207949 RepID=Q1N581_9GAMM|nr:enoyl-CoA hydratase/isomerase family protein [Bermanella marisrubri]EAT13197.1 probable enoyl-CoA hydratase/isomerase [Oceanobacter sp. RED65] [Bermanella marisrubri]QIZ83967.1 enoyl-CoA hydratase/isomerase family protein [Bermanella marisrubri]
MIEELLEKEYTSIALQQDGWVLHVTLNRPESRNAMSLAMVNELGSVFDAIEGKREIRAIILRGADGHFCAGGDIKDMANARAEAAKSDTDPYYQLNKQFGELIAKVNAAPQVVIAVLEGAVLGGGFGLACVSDVAIATDSAKFGLPETSLGIPPAQIAPFVVKRIGLTQARRLALLGARFDGKTSVELGISHFYAADESQLNDTLKDVLSSIQKCAPEANAMTKSLVLRAAEENARDLIDDAAKLFSQAVQGKEGMAGTMAFVQKKSAPWDSE